MSKKTTPLTWKDYISEKLGIRQRAIYNYFMVSDDLSLLPLSYHQFCFDVSFAIFCTNGSIAGAMSRKKFKAQAPCLLVLGNDETIEIESVSDDFRAWYNVLSKNLTEDLYSLVKQNMVSSIPFQTNPVLPITEVEMKRNIDLCQQLYAVMSDGNNPFAKEIIKHLTTAMYYMQHSEIASQSKPSKKDDLMVRFAQMVKDNYRRERRVQFYGNELCLSPKYLSQIVKEQTGKTAAEWIDSYVLAEAKALLRSSELTVQQISDELHFPDQSSFGKYFKRNVGMSPKEYMNRKS